MGTDIYEGLEYRPVSATSGKGASEVRWMTLPRPEGYYGDRDHDAFGCLFGVRNYANFVPVAAARGLPDDATAETRAAIAEMGGPIHGVTWLDYADVAAIDWDEPALYPDEQLHCYRRGPTGEWVYSGKALWTRDFAESVGYPASGVPHRCVGRPVRRPADRSARPACQPAAAAAATPSRRAATSW